MKIPKITHRIWFGEPFPEKYMAYLRKLAELNPDYQIKLWSDIATVSVESYATLKQFCESNRIELCNIREYTSLTNYDLIIQELEASKKTATHKKLHYVRASDIARIAILMAEGGIYMDTDCEPTIALPEFNAEHGILFKLLGIAKENIFANFFDLPFKNYHYYFSCILYDFIASVPEHILLETTAKITRQDYETYHASNNKTWENSTDAQVLLYGTVKLTGTALKWALNHSHQAGQFPIPNAKALFFDSDSIMKSYFDKSYLAGFTAATNDQYENQLNNFINEIENNRQTHFKVIVVKDPSSIEKLKEIPYANYMCDMDIPKVDDAFLKQLLKEKTTTTARSEIPEAKKFELPPIEFKLPELSIDLQNFKLELPFLTRQKIYDTYKKNGGGALARFSLFTCNPHKKPQELIKLLEARAAANTADDSASQKTLDELKTLGLYKS